MTDGETATDRELTAKIEPFDSFWEAPGDIEKGYRTFGRFYSHNYLPRFPEDREAKILVISCGPGYMLELLRQRGYRNVLGIDSVPEKVAKAEQRGLRAKVARMPRFFQEQAGPFDVIFAEQEINHLTKEEILLFLDLCRDALTPGGRLIVHSINGANPITGAESRAGNFDHYNSFTDYSLRQVLLHSGFVAVEAFPLHLYVFWRNPLNYVAWLLDLLNRAFFTIQFRLVGKDAHIFSKKLAAIAFKAAPEDVDPVATSAP